MKHPIVRGRAMRCGALIAVLICAVIAAWETGPKVAIIGPKGAARTIVRVEIANTSAQRELGLMYRKHLDEDAGMLFIFPASDQLGFWMKNTEIPLDMIFADSDRKVVGIVENAEPYSERTVGVDGPSQYVLEVNGGFAARHQVKAGDTLRFEGFAPTAH